jgi:8-oxo-dGTP diphosphatase
MHLITAKAKSQDVNKNCDEGELVWIDKSKVYQLPIWEGDKIFFRLLEKDAEFFSLKLIYEKDKLIGHVLE